jgi:hypothetical protein
MAAPFKFHSIQSLRNTHFSKSYFDITPWNLFDSFPL